MKDGFITRENPDGRVSETDGERKKNRLEVLCLRRASIRVSHEGVSLSRSNRLYMRLID